MKLGILGTGVIAYKVAQTLKQMDEIECYAVASRTLENALAFKRELGFEKAYGSYKEMVEDPNLELVYVTSPHSHHFEHMMLCMEHGKAVICEKAFTLNAEQATAVMDYSRTHGVFAAEAIWTRYMPSRKIIDDFLKSGAIGEVKALTANLSYLTEHRERMHRPDLAGGALLDVGVYGINFAMMHFGDDIDRIESSVKMTSSGVDEMENMTLFYKDGRMAMLSAGMNALSDRQGVFYGTKGYAIVENINNPQSITVYDDNHSLVKRIEVPEQISGYEYEFRECVKAIEEKRTESWSMPLQTSVEVMEIMDGFRRQWGLVYPMEK